MWAIYFLYYSTTSESEVFLMLQYLPEILSPGDNKKIKWLKSSHQPNKKMNGILFKVEKDTKHCDEGQIKNIRKTSPENGHTRDVILAPTNMIAFLIHTSILSGCPYSQVFPFWVSYNHALLTALVFVGGNVSLVLFV